MANKRRNIRENSTNNRNNYDYQSYRKSRESNKNILMADEKLNKREYNNRKKTKRAKTKRKSIVVIAFILIYVPSLFNWLYGNNVSTGIIYSGKIEDSINTNALIIREEELIESSFDGKYIPISEEGEKVAANSVIATVLKESSSSLLDEVNEINQKIIFAQNEKNEVSDVFSQDIQKLDNEIGYKVNSLIGELNNNRMDNIKKLKTEIDEIIQRKVVIIGNEQSEDVYIKSLKEQKDKLEKQMVKSIEEKRTTFSGVVSFVIDGYEEILNTNAIKEITPEDFNKIISDNLQNTEKEYRKTSINKPFAKVTKDLGCYLLLCQDANSIGSLKEGNIIYIRINDINKTMKSTIEYVSEKKSGKYMISLKIDKYANELSSSRKLNVDLIKSTYEGLMVPIRSLLDINLTKMVANIVIMKANYASVREVVIKGINNEYAVVTSGNTEQGISLYDTYIINPKNIHDGQVISQ